MRDDGHVLNVFIMDKKKLTIIGVVVAVLVVGGLVNRMVGKSAAERAIEEATGGSVDIDGDGSDVTVKTADGTYTGSSKIPENFPSDVPVYSDAKVQGSYAVNGASGQGYTVALQTDDSLADVTAWYKREVVAKGWTVATEMTVEGSYILSATKDSRGLNVSVSADDDGVTIGLVVASQ
jgi:hypothetical protein